ncbi:MAG: hypothetical protein AAB664_03370 [Patescibacteria group bacterium]
MYNGSSWSDKTPGGTSRSWTTVASDSTGTNLAAAYNAGDIYTSSNSGTTWAINEPSGTASANWREVESNTDGTKLFAAISGQSGQLWLMSPSSVPEFGVFPLIGTVFFGFYLFHKKFLKESNGIGFGNFPPAVS